MPPSARYRPDPRHVRLGAAFFDVVQPAAFPQTIIRYRNRRWAERIGLESLSDEEWIRHFARFEPLPGNLPQALALRYHGHQFQSYNPDLGDGRGFLFAQVRDPDGRLLDLATKGSGQTPWSRFGDGRLTLKGGVREVLATEMLEALGVYTSKSFSLIETGEALQRNDEPSPTRSSVLVRLGHSHVRFGTFQRFAALNDGASIQALLDYSIAEYWPQAADAPDRALAFFEHVSNAVARMAAQWFAAGFVHGVLNTDNTLITGESFDYGPWRFLPVLDPRFTAAYFDQTGLYAFSRQPASLLWNLARLAECIAHASSVDAMNGVLEQFFAGFEAHLAEATAHRLAVRFPDVETAVGAVNLFYGALMKSQVPFERAFFDLAGGASPQRLARSPIAPAYESETWSAALTALRAAEALPLRHGYFERSGPVTMLIDDVEALWAPIADADDWTAFEAKLRDIADVREAYAGLAAAV